MQFQSIQFLVDGSHWSSKQKFSVSKPGTRSGGHLGCSSSYNFNLYKKYTSIEMDGAKNSQGREQMHTTLSGLGKSLRQMNFRNFKNYLTMFFAINNLTKQNLL